MADLLVGQLASDASQWVQAAARAAAGPLLCRCCRGSAAALPSPDGAAADLDADGGAARKTALALAALYVEAVTWPRPPPPDVLASLAGCLPEVASCIVPRLASWDSSGLDAVYR